MTAEAIENDRVNLPILIERAGNLVDQPPSKHAIDDKPIAFDLDRIALLPEPILIVCRCIQLREALRDNPACYERSDPDSGRDDTCEPPRQQPPFRRPRRSTCPPCANPLENADNAHQRQKDAGTSHALGWRFLQQVATEQGWRADSEYDCRHRNRNAEKR